MSRPNFTPAQYDRLRARGIYPYADLGPEIIVEMYGRQVRASRRDILKIAEPSLIDRLKGFWRARV